MCASGFFTASVLSRKPKRCTTHWGGVGSKLPGGRDDRGQGKYSGDPQLDLVNVCLTVPGLTGEVTPPSSSPHPSPARAETADAGSGRSHAQKDTPGTRDGLRWGKSYVHPRNTWNLRKAPYEEEVSAEVGGVKV